MYKVWNITSDEKKDILTSECRFSQTKIHSKDTMLQYLMTFSKFGIYFQLISNCHLQIGINFFGTPYSSFFLRDLVHSLKNSNLAPPGMTSHSKPYNSLPRRRHWHYEWARSLRKIGISQVRTFHIGSEKETLFLCILVAQSMWQFHYWQ